MRYIKKKLFPEKKEIAKNDSHLPEFILLELAP